jgi:hypothetical protein
MLRPTIRPQQKQRDKGKPGHESASRQAQHVAAGKEVADVRTRPPGP